MNFKAVLALPKTAHSAQTHKSIRFIWIVWSTLYVYLWVLLKNRENLLSEKFQNCNSHFYNGDHTGAISILKWDKISVIVMGFTKASGHLRKKRNQLGKTFPKVNNNMTSVVEYHFRIYRIRCCIWYWLPEDKAFFFL